MTLSNLGTEAKASLHAIVSIGGNSAIFTLIPPSWQPVAFVLFNLAQVIYAFVDPTYTVHLIQTGQMAAPQVNAVPTPPPAQPTL